MNKPTISTDQRSQWEFVLDHEGKRTNVRCLRGTTIIEVLYKGEKILVDVADMKPVDLMAESVYSG